jgi:tripartite-type tricarboxylate transporter receptor subunit TctC
MSAPALKETASGISRRLLLCGASGAALVAHSAAAQNTWPQKPIRLVVPFAAGGGTDIVARMIGRTLSQQLGQPVVIDNKPGASTLIGTEIAARARPDGYTLLLAASTSYSVNPALRAARAYNPSRDLAPIAIVARVPLVLFAGGTAPWHSLSELVGAAKARPGQIRYATFGNASGSHLTGELFALAAGIRLQDIPYRGSSQAMVAVIGGEVDLGIDTVASVAPHARSGKVRALGIVGAARSGLLPGVRTLAEQGLPEASFAVVALTKSRSANSVSSGASLISEWPACTVTTFALRALPTSALVARTGVIWSASPSRNSTGHCTVSIAASPFA